MKMWSFWWWWVSGAMLLVEGGIGEVTDEMGYETGEGFCLKDD